MKRTMNPKVGRRTVRLRAALLIAVALAGIWRPASVQAKEEPKRRQAESLSPAVAKDLLAAYELVQNDKLSDSLASLNNLMQRRGESMKPFDKASVLQIRGTVHASLDRHSAAIQDFQEALSLDALPPEPSAQLRYNLAQLHFQSENYQQAATTMQAWISATPNAPHNAWYVLAAAHYYLQNYQAARPAIENALGRADKPQRRYYDLSNIVYSELGLNPQRLRVLQRMVELWPDEVSYWKQLAAVQQEQKEQRQALTTMELAYKTGLLNDQPDLLSLVQLYAVQGNPHRGASLLAHEMQAKRIERNVRNLELLAQLMSQAREHSKAIPVLREAARLSESGTLYYRLGQVLLANEDYPEAEKALQAAIEKGGLDASAKADVWMLLGAARFNQAGPGERDQRLRADQAFASAERFDSTHRRASEWRSYIKAINDTEDRQEALEREQTEALAQAAAARALASCRTLQLSDRPLTERCQEVLADGGEG